MRKYKFTCLYPSTSTEGLEVLIFLFTIFCFILSFDPVETLLLQITGICSFQVILGFLRLFLAIQIQITLTVLFSRILTNNANHRHWWVSIFSIFSLSWIIVILILSQYCDSFICSSNFRFIRLHLWAPKIFCHLWIYEFCFVNFVLYLFWYLILVEVTIK